MKAIRSVFKFFLIVVPVISSQYLPAQDGSELITAVAYQDLDKVKSLIEDGVDINYQEENYGSTALIMACQYNFVDIARYLIEKGADFNIRMKTGHNALMAAAVISGELVDLLMSKGADISVKLEDGTSAFTISISGAISEYIGLEIAKKLLDKGANSRLHLPYNGGRESTSRYCKISG